MQRNISLCAILFFFCAEIVQAGESSVSFFVDSNSYSNVIPIKELLKDDWRTQPSKEANKAYTVNKLGFKYNYQQWQFSLFKRVDYIAETNYSTASLYYAIEADQSLEIGKANDLLLNLKGFTSNAAAIGYQFEWNNLTFNPYVTYYEISRMRQSELIGAVSIDEHENLSGKIFFNESYTHSNFFKRPHSDWQQKTSGVSLGFSVGYQINNKLLVSLKLDDLYNKISFSNTGFSQGVINTENRFLPNNSLKSITPLLTGIESEKEQDFLIPLTTELTFSYGWNQYNFIGEYKRYAGHERYWLGGEININKQGLALVWDIKNNIPKLTFKSRPLNISLAVDKLNVNKATQLLLTISTRFSL